MVIVDTHCHVSPYWYEPVETLLHQMNSNGVDIQEFVPLGTINPRVVQRREVFGDGCACCLNHYYPSLNPNPPIEGVSRQGG